MRYRPHQRGASPIGLKSGLGERGDFGQLVGLRSAAVQGINEATRDNRNGDKDDERHDMIRVRDSERVKRRREEVRDEPH